MRRIGRRCRREARTITLNWIDWITLAVVLVSILRGAKYGLVAGALDIFMLLVTFFFTSAQYQRGVELLKEHLFLPPAWAGLVSFVIIWLGLYSLSGILFRWSLGETEDPTSRTLGGVAGSVRGVVLVTAFLVIALAAPFRESVQPDADRSRVAPYLLEGYERLVDVVLPTFYVRVPRIGPGGATF